MKQFLVMLLTLLLFMFTSCGQSTDKGDSMSEGSYYIYSNQKELISGSDIIALVKTGSVSNYNIDDVNYSVISLEVVEFYVGDMHGEQIIQLKQLLSDNSVHHSGSSQYAFEPETEYIVCLIDTHDNYYMLVNPIQGVYRIDVTGLPVGDTNNPVVLDISNNR